MEESNSFYSSKVDQRVQKGASIHVKDPKKVGEGRDAYISYTVEIGDHGVERRYSDFASFRETLFRLNPTSIIPPIPEKQQISISSLPKGSVTSDVIEKRRKRLEGFLNRVAAHPLLSASPLFLRFLETPNWGEVIAQETDKSQGGFFSNLTLSERKVLKPDPRFVEISHQNHAFGQHASALDRSMRKLVRRQTELTSDYAELGSAFSHFSNSEKELQMALEKCGSAVDNSFMSLRFLVSKVEDSFLEPFQDLILYSDSVKQVLSKRDHQHAQFEALVENLSSKKISLNALENPETAPPPETGFFRSLSTSFSKMIDTNPEQTRKENIAKLQTSIAQLEADTDNANSALVKSSQHVLFEIQDYEKKKALEMKELLATYVRAQIEYYQKEVQTWGFVVPVIEEIPSD